MSKIESIWTKTGLPKYFEGITVLIQFIAAAIYKVYGFADSCICKNAYISKNIYMIKTKSIW